MDEYQHGSSFMGGIAGVGGGSSGSAAGGVAGSLGGSTSSSSGSRDVTGSTIQKLSDNITQVSSSMRELQSTVVVHSIQSEKEAIETRTVVNYNHSHALTILYYEVLRHFRVVTEFTGRRPVVLVLIKTEGFDGDDKTVSETIRDNRGPLSAALLDPHLAAGFDATERIEQRLQLALALPPTPPVPSPPVPPLAPGDRDFIFFTFEMHTGGFSTDDWINHSKRIEITASLLRDGPVVELMDQGGVAVLNQRGSFRQADSTNTFTALPKGDPSVRWSTIKGIQCVIRPLGGDDVKVSFVSVKVTAIDTGDVGEVLVDQSYAAGNFIVMSEGGPLLLPTRRPPPPPPPTAPAQDILQDDADHNRLIGHLKAHAIYYSRAIYLGGNAVERAAEMEAIKLADGASVLEKIENRPIEIVGNYLAYPCTDPTWNALVMAKFDSNPDAQSAPPVAPLDERLVTLPTRGVFAEAKLGHCNASELIDNTRFWDWQQSPIPHFAPEIAPTVPVTPQPSQSNLSPTPFPSSIVNIVNPPNAPDPTGLSAAMSVLGTPNLFRDMSGRPEVAAILQNLADNAEKIAASTMVGKAGQSGSGGSSTGGTRGTGGGGSVVGGPRATATQPSATNRDLQDFGSVLGRAQSQGLIGPGAAQQAYANVLAAATGQPTGDALSSADLPSGEFIPFVDAKRLDPAVAAVLSGFMSAPLDSWRYMIARFALAELSANRLIGIVSAAQANDIRQKFIDAASDPQPSGEAAAKLFDDSIAIGSSIGVTIGASAKNGGRTAYILLSAAGLDGTARITRGATGGSVTVSLLETLVHELAHVRNQSNQQILLAFPDTAAAIYVDPTFAAAQTAANSGDPQSATVQVLRRFTEEMTARHVHWRVRTELGTTSTLNVSIEPAQLAVATLEYFTALNGIFASRANSYVQEINRRGIATQLNQIGMWLNVCSFYAFSDRPDQDGDSRQLFRSAATWSSQEAAKAIPLADIVEAQGLAPLLRDFV